MTIRKTTVADVGLVMQIFERAKRLMAENGNAHQWIDGYPQREVIEGDIERGVSYVIEHECAIVGTFCFIVGDDPTYAVIDGDWLNDKPYGTIHRIASSGEVKGIADCALDHCMRMMDNIRIDTHKDNRPMRNWITRRGFMYCGVILTHNGSPRLAYQLNREV
ncbi:MAG: GNAT family N-acetyltransferase [Bacteroides sp.]|nr:GNAT family N-acetyltransferase [Bacteroides sp.]